MTEKQDSLIYELKKPEPVPIFALVSKKRCYHLVNKDNGSTDEV